MIVRRIIDLQFLTQFYHRMQRLRNVVYNCHVEHAVNLRLQTYLANFAYIPLT